jgi:hypothetical protein
MRAMTLKTRSFALLLALALGLPGERSSVSAQPRLGSEIVDAPEVWRAFQPLVKACGAGDAKAAVRYLEQSSDIVRKADAKLERDNTTETFRAKAIDSLEDFDLAGFLELLPEPSESFRRFAFQGAPTQSAYKVVAVTGDKGEVHASSARRAFGDSSGAVRMRKLASGHDKHFGVELKGGVGIGELPWSRIVDGLSDAIALMERGPIAPAEPIVLRAADSYIAKTQPKLSGADRGVLAAAWASYPELAKLLVALGSTEDVIDEARSVEGATRLNLTSRWDVAGLKKAYPALAEYFAQLGDLADYRTTVSDANGNVLLTAHLNTARVESGIAAFVHDGKLVPSKDGKPLVGTAPAFAQMTVRTDMHFVLHRVHLYVDDYRLGLRYRDQAGVAELQLEARSVPKVRVRGAAFGVVPAAMLDWFIPGDIEGLTKHLFQTAAKANGGRGTVAHARFAAPGGAPTTVDGQVAFEVLDSALIRMAMAIIADKVVPDEDQEEDMRRLAVAYRDAFDADLARFARYGATR